MAEILPSVLFIIVRSLQFATTKKEVHMYTQEMQNKSRSTALLRHQKKER